MKKATRQQQPKGYWALVWSQFKQHPLGVIALGVILLFCLVGIYAPLLASSKPLVVYFEGQWFFPLFRYLFYPSFYTKYLDIFYNLLMFTIPLFFLAYWLFRHHSLQRKIALSAGIILQFTVFLSIIYSSPRDPAVNLSSLNAKSEQLKYFLKGRQDPLFPTVRFPNWSQEVQEMTPYARLNLVLRYQQRKAQHEKFLAYAEAYAKSAQKTGKDQVSIPSLWQQEWQNEQDKRRREQQTIDAYAPTYFQDKEIVEHLQVHCAKTGLPPWVTCEFLNKAPEETRKELIQARKRVDAFELAQATLRYLDDRQAWLEEQSKELRFEVMPLLRPFHWEEDAGGSQALNQHIGWWDLTRINRKDMVAALIFGIRVSLSVGLLAVGLALLIGIPLGAIAGFYGGKVDILLYRLIEIWESMPTFFMLLMIVAFLQSKSIFLVIGVIGLFGWTQFSRFLRGEFLRQKQLPYVEACRALGFNDSRIMFSHLLPNSIPPILTLIPFAIMGAITSEAGLSFLGLGEEGSNSWGVLMDEGRSAFPSESYLLWPPAILLTILLVAIALVGDSLRDALDPKLHR